MPCSGGRERDAPYGVSARWETTPQPQAHEFFKPTLRLRWRVSAMTTTQPPVLEQMWSGSLGSVQWRAVPVEVVG